MGDPKARALGNAQMHRHQIKAGDRFGHRVFDLNPRINLEEKIVVARDQKLNRTQSTIVQALSQFHRIRCNLVKQGTWQTPCRSFLDHLLMTALQSAVAFKQMHHMARAVARNLHLDVSRGRQEAFQQHALGPECGLRLTQGPFDVLHQCVLSFDQTLTAPATATNSLEKHREAHLAHCGGNFGGVGFGTARARDHRNACRNRRVFGAGLVTETIQRFGRWADKDHPGGFDSIGKIRILGQKAIAGMDRIGTHLARGVKHSVDPEVAFAGRPRPDQDGATNFAHMQCVRVCL